jgi:gamma-glutamyltranspeptidase/glutathione hydrolase
MKVSIAHLLLLCVGHQLAQAAPGACPAPKPEARRGAVASENAACSKIGTQLLEDGGNAVDAMVGTVFCVGVIAMYHSGIGGGGFMLLRSKDGEYEFIDFRETAPAASYEDMYTNNTEASLRGGMAR